MQPVMSVADVREFEESCKERGLSSAELMRRAGAVVAMQAAKYVDGGSVVVLCGMGNNGGDGWVAADFLARHGYEVQVVTPAVPALIRGEEARNAATTASEMGIPVHVGPDYEELASLIVEADVVVDAVFGIGFSGAMPAPYDQWVEIVDDYFEGVVLSIDVPSGIDASTGMAAGPFFQADVTVTMFALKPCLVSGLGKTACGEVVVAGLVSDDEGLSELSEVAAAFKMNDADYMEVFPQLDELADKYGRGSVLVVAGSSRYPGAAIMAAMAAARSGAGYVTLAVPAPVVPVAQAHLLSIPVVGLPADAEGAFDASATDLAAKLALKADAVLAGPGMTTSFGACEVVRGLMEADVPLVLDADALNALVKICTGSAEEHPNALRREKPLVLTPHARELARLVAADPSQTATLSGAMTVAQELAWAVGSANFAVLAKGPVTVASTIDSTLIPEPGPCALATAGTGDVLAGVVAGLLGQQVAFLGDADEIGSSDLLLLVAGADRVHSVAGEMAAAHRGSRGVVATDVAELVGLAFDEVVRRAAQALEGSDEEVDEDGLDYGEEAADEVQPARYAGSMGMGEPAPEIVIPGELKAYEGDLDEPDTYLEEDDEADEEAEEDDIEETDADAEVEPEADEAEAEEEPETDEEDLDEEDFEEAPEEVDETDEAEEELAEEPEDELDESEDESEADDLDDAEDEDEDLEEESEETDEADSEDPEEEPVEETVAPVVDDLPEDAVIRPSTRVGSDGEAVGKAASGVPSFLAGGAAAAPAAKPASRAACVPDFLAPHTTVKRPSDSRPVTSTDTTTIMPALTIQDLVEAVQASRSNREEADPELAQRQEERRRIEDFHERATMRVGEDEVIPAAERPHARKIRRKR